MKNQLTVSELGTILEVSYYIGDGGWLLDNRFDQDSEEYKEYESRPKFIETAKLCLKGLVEYTDRDENGYVEIIKSSLEKIVSNTVMCEMIKEKKDRICKNMSLFLSEPGRFIKGYSSDNREEREYQFGDYNKEFDLAVAKLCDSHKKNAQSILTKIELN